MTSQDLFTGLHDHIEQEIKDLNAMAEVGQVPKVIAREYTLRLYRAQSLLVQVECTMPGALPARAVTSNTTKPLPEQATAE